MAVWVDFIFLSLFYDHPFVTEEGGNFNRFVKCPAGHILPSAVPDNRHNW